MERVARQQVARSGRRLEVTPSGRTRRPQSILLVIHQVAEPELGLQGPP
jgi:hypothetical protein